VFLYGFTAFTIVLTMLTRIPDSEDSGDFHTLLLGSVLGMVMMTAANNLLIVFLAVEMASVPSYALAGFMKGRKKASEAALKYVVFGGAAAGTMLYGISLLAGMFGTIHLPSLAGAMLKWFASGGGTAFDPLMLTALALISVGFAFKLSAVPFHFWCPDVFEGAAAEVAGFLSVASKAAAVALLARFSMTLMGEFQGAEAISTDWKPAILGLAKYLTPMLGAMAAITVTLGNLVAIRQTNIKRMLAWSTIAHAGFMLFGLATLKPDGVQAALVYLVMYFFLNLGAFAVVAFVRNHTGSEEIEAYTGLIHRAPVLTVAMCILLLGLVGLPPTAGFIAKLMVMNVLVTHGEWTLLAIAGVNTAISLYYYVNVMRVMVIAGEGRRLPDAETGPERLFISLVTAPVLVLGIFFSVPVDFAKSVVSSMKLPPSEHLTPNPVRKPAPAAAANAPTNGPDRASDSNLAGAE
jgi:NADH-quinone oxidoreductase subunit N